MAPNISGAPNTITRASPRMHSSLPNTNPNAVTVPHPPAVDTTTKASPKLLPGEKLMGVDVINVDPIIADQYGLPLSQGCLVNGVQPGSSADLGGLK
ncbi:MAG: hypothetical protein LHV68_05970, partial [Elusimicrobia bacterium]|nr:hypothetical protein [Candidatus Liberimonas magnetica]